MRPLYTAIMAYLGFLAFAPAAGLAEDIKIQGDCGGIEGVFPIDEESNTLQIPDNVNTSSGIKEILQGGEKEKFDPILAMYMEIPVANTAYDRLKAEQYVHCAMLKVVTDGYKRDGELIIPDGFSVDFSSSGGKTPEETILTAAIIFYKALKENKKEAKKRKD